MGRLGQWMLGKFHPCHKNNYNCYYFYCLSLELANIILHVIMHVRLLRLSFKEVVKLDQFVLLGALVCGVSRFKAM